MRVNQAQGKETSANTKSRVMQMEHRLTDEESLLSLQRRCVRLERAMMTAATPETYSYFKELLEEAQEKVDEWGTVPFKQYRIT